MEEVNDTDLIAARQMLVTEKEQEEQMKILRIRRKMAEKDKEMLQKLDPQEIAHIINDAGMASILKDTLSKLREMKPDERSERSRRYAITITEMEKVVAYFKTWIIDEN